jgi:hypothetical protein
MMNCVEACASIAMVLRSVPTIWRRVLMVFFVFSDF